MNIDKYGRVFITEQEAFESLYSGKIKSLENVLIQGNIDQYNQAKLKNADRIPELLIPKDLDNQDLITFDRENQSHWFMPKKYYEFPLIDWIYQQCKTDKEISRVDQELELFVQYNLLDLLFYLKYLVDTMRDHKIVWGVGRGSCVASYVLYLIGVHKINSIQYDLDIKEFLKEN